VHRAIRQHRRSAKCDPRSRFRSQARLHTIWQGGPGRSCQRPGAAPRGYRDCVALMWDRKHPAEVKRRQEEARLRICEAYRLREGDNCDCTLGGTGQPLQWVTPLTPEEFAPAWEEKAASPCDPLSLEDLRRADAEASRDEPPR
jgi:hypothetical protein